MKFPETNGSEYLKIHICTSMIGYIVSTTYLLFILFQKYSGKTSLLGILDIYGFEIFDENG
jgi:myosin heavy subunit